MASARKVPTTLAPKPVHRMLKAYAFDPSRGKNYGNYMTMGIPFEDLPARGPVGDYVAVVDYDGANQRYYEAVDLNDRWILANNGLDPSESDPRFHQQMVYAVVSETIDRFKFALGRDIHWRADRTRKNSPFHNRLLLLPHAMQEANAYYDPEMHAIVFGYFPASQTDPGNNLPGQIIFTCLAHDIIAHETTHALVDGIRRFFMEPTNPDVAAFHEGFADIVALFQHFSLKEAVLEALRGTQGMLQRLQMSAEIQPTGDGPRITAELTKNNPLVILANQFGDAIGLHSGLRSAIGTPPNSKALEEMTEPHDRGSILVAAVFDAFFTTYLRRTQDLWRIAGISRDRSTDVALHPDLVARLAAEASKTARHFETLCIRALDYCPPVDITFGDYLQALITADHDLVRDDDLGYRAALIDAFRARGIRPQYVASYSEEALLWRPPEGPSPVLANQTCMVPLHTTDKERRTIMEQNARILYLFASRYANVFGLKNPKHIFVNSFHYIHRVGPDGQLALEMVAEVIEKEKLKSSENGAQTEVFGGVTLIFSTDGKVRYAVRKSLKQHTGRAESQASFRQENWERTTASAYSHYTPKKIDFRAIHRRF